MSFHAKQQSQRQNHLAQKPLSLKGHLLLAHGVLSSHCVHCPSGRNWL